MNPSRVRPSTDEQTWRREALCLGSDPDLWFPLKNQSADEGKRICRVCPVRQACLDHAIDHRETLGIWGGFAEKTRAKIRRHRARGVSHTLEWYDADALNRGRRRGRPPAVKNTDDEEAA